MFVLILILRDDGTATRAPHRVPHSSIVGVVPAPISDLCPQVCPEVRPLGCSLSGHRYCTWGMGSPLMVHLAPGPQVPCMAHLGALQSGCPPHAAVSLSFICIKLRHLLPSLTASLSALMQAFSLMKIPAWFIPFSPAPWSIETNRWRRTQGVSLQTAISAPGGKSLCGSTFPQLHYVCPYLQEEPSTGEPGIERGAQPRGPDPGSSSRLGCRADLV